MNRCCVVKLIKKHIKENVRAIVETFLVSKNLYGFVFVWAEEAGALEDLGGTDSEFSYGNGASGNIGLSVCQDDLEVVGLSLQADTYASTSKVVIEFGYYSNAGTSVSFTPLAEIELKDAKDGGGDTDHAHKCIDLAAPVSIPSNVVVGFRTKDVTGSIGDVRVKAKLRYLVGSALSYI